MRKALLTIAMIATGALLAQADDTRAPVTNPPVNNATPPPSVPPTTYPAETSGMAGKFGAGATFGEPIGASLKYFLFDTLAVDGAIGWSTHDHSDFYVQNDLLWHNFNLIPVSQGRAGVYVGGGWLFRKRNSGEDDQFGLRAPLGVAYLFENAPVDVFAEIGPALDVTPDVRGEVTGGVGVRFWF